MTEIKGPTIARQKELAELADNIFDLHRQLQLVFMNYSDLLLYLKDSHLENIKTTLTQFLLNCHGRRIMIHFDEKTLKFLHLLDQYTLTLTFSKCLELKGLQNRAPNAEFLSLNFSSRPHKAEDIEQEDIDKMINMTEYEKLLEKGRGVYLFSIKERDLLLGCYVEDDEVSARIFKPGMYTKFETTRMKIERVEKECHDMEVEKRIETFAMQRDKGGYIEEMTRNSLRNMIERIDYDSDKIIVDKDLMQFIARRIGTLTHCENGITGSSTLFDGFFEHSTTMTNHTLERIKKERADLNGRIRLSRGTLTLADFDTTKKKAHSPFIKEIMADDENRIQIERHQELNISINTMDVMLGKDALSRTIIPCIVKNAYNRNVQYVLNVYGDINITNNNVVTAPNKENAIVEEVCDIKKRKRAPENKPSDIRRRIITEREYNEETTKKKDNGEPTELPYVVIKRDRVYKSPDEKQTRECDACYITYPLSSFYNRKKNIRGGPDYQYLTNICNGCIKKNEKTKRKSNMSL